MLCYQNVVFWNVAISRYVINREIPLRLDCPPLVEYDNRARVIVVREKKYVSVKRKNVQKRVNICNVNENAFVASFVTLSLLLTGTR